MTLAIDLSDQMLCDFRALEREAAELRAARDAASQRQENERAEVALAAARELQVARQDLATLRAERAAALQESELSLSRARLLESQVRELSTPKPCEQCAALRRELDAALRKQSAPPPAAPPVASDASRQALSHLQAQVAQLEKESRSNSVELKNLKRMLKEEKDRVLGLDRVIKLANERGVPPSALSRT